MRNLLILTPTLALLVYFFAPQGWTQPTLALTAAPTKLTWKAPIARSDGYPFDMLTEGSEYRVSWIRGQNSGIITLPKTATEMSLTGFKAGTGFTIVACDDTVPPVCSLASNEVKISGGPPLPPSEFKSSE